MTEQKKQDFLKRWSQRKSQQRARSDLSEQELSDNLPAQADADLSADQIIEESSEERELSDSELCARYQLPEPETCTNATELDRFFEKPLPDRLRQLAMRRLWRLNPLFRFADEMVEYGENYTDAATVIPDMQSAYKVGKGYLDKILAEQKQKQEQAELAEAAISEQGVESQQQHTLDKKSDKAKSQAGLKETTDDSQLAEEKIAHDDKAEAMKSSDSEDSDQNIKDHQAIDDQLSEISGHGSVAERPVLKHMVFKKKES